MSKECDFKAKCHQQRQKQAKHQAKKKREQEEFFKATK